MQNRRQTFSLDNDATEVTLADLDMGYHGKGTHMFVLDKRTGDADNVFVYYENDQPKLKRMVQKMEFAVPPSPAVSETSGTGWTIADSPLSAETTARLLKVYRELE